MSEKTEYIVIISILIVVVLLLARQVYKNRQYYKRHSNSNRVPIANSEYHSQVGIDIANRGGGTPVSMHRQVENRTVASQTPSNNSNETGRFIYFANDRHHSRDKEYHFKYKKVGNSWRAYILRTPSFGNRSTDSATIHRLSDSQDGFYICWDRPINTLKEMQIVSRKWADCIQEYISTGVFG